MSDESPSAASTDDPGTTRAVPTPIISGSFAIYEDGRRGYVMVANTAEFGVQRKHIPAAAVRAFRTLARGMGGFLPAAIGGDDAAG